MECVPQAQTLAPAIDLALPSQSSRPIIDDRSAGYSSPSPQATTSRQPPPPPSLTLLLRTNDSIESSRTFSPIKKPNLTTRSSSINPSANDHPPRLALQVHSPRDERANQRSPAYFALEGFRRSHLQEKIRSLEKALNNDRLNSPQEKNNAATFNARFKEYKAALIQAQEVEVQATQKGDKTIIPTSKILKLETRREPLNETIPEKEKTTKKKILPLESTLGDSSISSFTTEPYFEDLEPTASLPSPAKKRKNLPIAPPPRTREDSTSSNPNLEPLHPDPEKRAKQARRTDEVPQTMEGNDQTPKILGIIRKPRSSNVSQTSNETESETESESEDEIQEAEIIKILIKKHVKIHASYLKAIVDEDMRESWIKLNRANSSSRN
ncbi:hypothetical protein KEM48_006160 [Puccinia striiformis f. sp. tritici PST-130]|nr:hypothetical protein KEM48_006160 [Puccinia striiformis f. sp. tritici PST-130]